MTTWSDDFTSPQLHPRWQLLGGDYSPPGLTDAAVLGPQISESCVISLTADPIGDVVRVVAVDSGLWLAVEVEVTANGYVSLKVGDFFNESAILTGALSLRRQDGMWTVLVDGQPASDGYVTLSAPDEGGDLYLALEAMDSTITQVSYAETVAPSLSWGGDIQSLWWDGPVDAVYMGATLVWSAGPDVFTGMWGPTTVSQGDPKSVVFAFTAPASGMYQVDLTITGDTYSVLKSFSINGVVVKEAGGLITTASEILAVRSGEVLTYELTQRSGSATMTVEYTVTPVPSNVPYSGSYPYSAAPFGSPGLVVGTYLVSEAGQYRLRMNDTSPSGMTVAVFRGTTSLRQASGASASINDTFALSAGDAIYFRYWSSTAGNYSYGGTFSAEPV